MTKIQFDLWANEQAVFATAFCLLSSIIGAAGILENKENTKFLNSLNNSFKSFPVIENFYSLVASKKIMWS